jgi:hypothetical protein
MVTNNLTPKQQAIRIVLNLIEENNVSETVAKTNAGINLQDMIHNASGLYKITKVESYLREKTYFEEVLLEIEKLEL